ncbi:hypothetical protein CDD80_1101 [Ophiocordyceps camponoti-rufipedis]|uniref:Uncharacterized protein n=1 Tax=Ophiocordyceps camponoti-rufipedis TaxID=2004952 RepID=A0A2C5Z7D5_9HYPO|nr:hypothetical protein CDD80_1101 [Ophiocordyceps camponoti-rufipedis]
MKFTTVSSLLLAVATASPVEQHMEKAQALDSSMMATDMAQQEQVADMAQQEKMADMTQHEQAAEMTTLNDMLGDVVSSHPDILAKLLSSLFSGNKKQMDKQMEKRDGAATEQLGSVLGNLLDNEIAGALLEATISVGHQNEKRNDALLDKLLGGLLPGVGLEKLRLDALLGSILGGSLGEEKKKKLVKEVVEGAVKKEKLEKLAQTAGKGYPKKMDMETDDEDDAPEETKSVEEMQAPAAEAPIAETTEAIKMEKRDSALNLDLSSLLLQSLGESISADQDSSISLTPLVDSLLADKGAVNTVTEGLHDTLTASHDLDRRDTNLGNILGLNLASLLGAVQHHHQGHQGSQAGQSAAEKQLQEGLLLNALQQLQQATMEKENGQMKTEGPAPRQ